MDKHYTSDELIEWLRQEIDRFAWLQASHPHLAHIPTDEDREKFQEICRRLKEWAADIEE